MSGVPTDDVWWVLLILNPTRRSGVIKGTSLRVAYTGNSETRYGFVRTETREDAIDMVRDGLPAEERNRVSKASTGRMTDVVEVEL